MEKALIREMQPKELAEVASFAKLSQPDSGKRTLALVALVDGQVAGYAEMAPTFFNCEFISLLSVHPAHRRRGVATALMKAVEARCQGKKLFTSTNLSNQPMQALLGKIGYRRCGMVEDLDEADPELIFVKRLTASSG
jgi:GNAT superfamily N-acetyltransferase